MYQPQHTINKSPQWHSFPKCMCCFDFFSLSLKALVIIRTLWIGTFKPVTFFTFNPGCPQVGEELLDRVNNIIEDSCIKKILLLKKMIQYDMMYIWPAHKLKRMAAMVTINEHLQTKIETLNNV